MACLDNVQIVQTVTYSAAPNTVDGLVVGQIELDILNIGISPVSGTITVDRVRDTPVVDITDDPIEQVNIITSANETFVYNFYYPISNPASITINATVDIRINNCLYTASCNHVLLTPNENGETSECTVEVTGFEVVSGCTSALYYEYNELANVDDGSCSVLIPVLGCTNPYATNYDSNATLNDGSCYFSSGCTNPIANNYDEGAMIDDGSCACGDINLQLDFFNTIGESFVLTGNCDYYIEFDLITKIECEKFLAFFENDTRTVLEILNSLKINAQIFTLLDISGNPIEYSGGTVNHTGETEFLLAQEENIFEFNIENNPTGLGVKGTGDNCETFFDLIALELGLECQDYDETAWEVNWNTYTIGFNSDLLNTFTKFVLNFEEFRFGICTYVDNVKISSTCTDNYERCTLIPSVYGFELDRIEDNKKAWVDTTSVGTPTSRRYNIPTRETEYTDFDSRLTFNSKELELIVNPMKYIQQDVLDYYDEFGKFYQDVDERLLTLDLEKIETQMINVKHRQTIRSYSFLPYIYEQYLDQLECAPSKRLDYSYGLDIIKKTGTLWYQLVQQLIPATAIWDGNQYVLKNNVFNIMKHRYKKYSLDSGGDGENCAPSGVTVTCERISSVCFDESIETIDDLLISGVSDIFCEQTGTTACFSDFTGDGSFSGRLIHYTEESGDTIQVIDLFGYQNYDCGTGDTPIIPPVEVSGCTNPLAINYNPLATIDDGSCIICPIEVSGCTYVGAENYDSDANVDDGSCVFMTGVTGVTCTEDVSGFTCNLEYIDTLAAAHGFVLTLNSGTYVGGITGSWTISDMNHIQPIQSEIAYQTYIQQGTLANIPVNLTNYIEFGFNDLTPAGIGLALSPPATSDSPWQIGIFENLALPLFISGLPIVININFVTDSGCIFTGSVNMTLGDGGGVIVVTPITLTKIFP